MENNFYNGETIDFLLEGDENFDFSTSGNQLFKLFVYPDGTNTKDEANSELIKTIDSRDETEKDREYGEGFVTKGDGENLAHCILPYYETKEMKVGSYTVELLYGNSHRSVFMRNAAFTMVLANSNNID